MPYHFILIVGVNVAQSIEILAACTRHHNATQIRPDNQTANTAA
jgi:hypothetical protein